VAFSPDGKTVASGDDLGEIRLWDAVTGENVVIMKKPRNPDRLATVWSVAFSPDGKSVASGNADTTICLWRVPGKEKGDK